MINWVFDLDLTLYELKGGEFSYQNIIKPIGLREKIGKLPRKNYVYQWKSTT